MRSPDGELSVTWVLGTLTQVRTMRVAVNLAGAQRGVAIGCPDFVPRTLDANGVAPGWTSPAPEDPIVEGAQAAVEITDDFAHLCDGQGGRPRPQDRTPEANLPPAIRDKARARKGLNPDGTPAPFEPPGRAEREERGQGRQQ